MKDLTGTLWLDRQKKEFIICVQRRKHVERYHEYWEWLVFTFDARLGITPEQLKTGSRVFMNENAFISPMSVFDLELIA